MGSGDSGWEWGEEGCGMEGGRDSEGCTLVNLIWTEGGKNYTLLYFSSGPVNFHTNYILPSKITYLLS